MRGDHESTDLAGAAYFAGLDAIADDDRPTRDEVEPVQARASEDDERWARQLLATIEREQDERRARGVV